MKSNAIKNAEQDRFHVVYNYVFAALSINLFCFGDYIRLNDCYLIHLDALSWQVKSSAVRQSKITKGRFGTI